jgi:hypothetical protein
MSDADASEREKRGYNMKKSVVFIGAILLSGCAYMSGGSHEKLLIATLRNKSLEETHCTLQNDRGQWSGQPDRFINIKRDSSPVKVVCKNPWQSGEAKIKPQFKVATLVLNILIDYCILSCVVDSQTRAFFEYKGPVFITMKDNPSADELECVRPDF